MRARLTPEAAEQLLEILRYIARDDPRAAARFHERALDALAIAVRFPNSGREPPDLRNDGVREMIVAPYRILYRQVGETVVVVAISHGARKDPFRNFPPLR